VTVETAPPSAELDMVGERYRLIQRLVPLTAAVPGVWRAEDTVLNRPVTVTLYEPAGPAAAALLEHAHALSSIEHPTLPRVFDAENEQDRTWVVTEWVEGSTLAALLTEGPFDAPAAAATIAKLAEGVALAHRVGLAVGLLDPDHVVITPRGTVTLTRLRIGGATADDDVRHLGALLYAALTGVWPLSEVHSRRGDGGGLPTPRQARAGVPPELSAITMRALTPGQPGSITTAAALADALTNWHRQAAPEPFLADIGDDPYQDATRRRVPLVAAVIAGVCAIGLVALLISAVASKAKPDRPSASGPPSNSGQPTGTPPTATQNQQQATLGISNVTLLDPPPGGDGTENVNDIPKAHDGNPDTAWPTLTYKRNASFGNLKPGVGLVFDLGKSTSISGVRITTTLPGSSLQVLVSDTPATTVDGYQLLGQSDDTKPTTTVNVAPGTKGRYYLVWITKLVPVGAQFQADLAEVQFLGPAA
jgi:eukaryotic-like serine/threonine-protein kinase